MPDPPRTYGQLADEEIDALHSLGILPVDAVTAGVERAAAKEDGAQYDPLIGPFLTAEGAVARLACVDSVGELEVLRTEGRVLGLDSRVSTAPTIYPAWNIDGGAVLDGLPDVLSVLLPAAGPWAAAAWMQKSTAELGDMAPATALARGRKAPVVRSAERQASEWRRYGHASS